jgi:hypothetical protein
MQAQETESGAASVSVACPPTVKCRSRSAFALGGARRVMHSSTLFPSFLFGASCSLLLLARSFRLLFPVRPGFLSSLYFPSFLSISASVGRPWICLFSCIQFFHSLAIPLTQFLFFFSFLIFRLILFLHLTTSLFPFRPNESFTIRLSKHLPLSPLSTFSSRHYTSPRLPSLPNNHQPIIIPFSHHTRSRIPASLHLSFYFLPVRHLCISFVPSIHMCFPLLRYLDLAGTHKRRAGRLIRIGSERDRETNNGEETRKRLK